MKYSTRRYDGGSEIDLIREIERKHAIRQLIRLHHMQQEQQRGTLPHFLEELPREDDPACAVAEPPPPVQPQAAIPPLPPPMLPMAPLPLPPSARQKKSIRVFEALIMGPMEICVGVVGMLTALLAIVTFSYTRNPALTQQSKTVFRDCFRTFFKGMLDTLTCPGRALRRVLEQEPKFTGQPT